MKKLIITLAITFTALFTQAQTAVKQDASGNYISVSSTAENKDTGKTFTDSKGQSFKVYESAKGKLYINRKSKTSGKEYRQYLKLD